MKIPLGKRGSDLLALCVLAPLVVPLTVVVALAVWLDSPGPVIYRATRVGLGGRAFTMLKFRSMRTNVAGNAIAGGGEDTRITPVGRFLRAARLDELPQLWHVLRGEMSLVGPRPELPEFVDLHAKEYREILAVPPGITGPTQLRYAGAEVRLLSGRDDPDAYYREHLLPGKVALDLSYARSSSLREDVTALACTLALPLTMGWRWLRRAGTAQPRRWGHATAYTGAAIAIAILPLVFALGLGSPR